MIIIGITATQYGMTDKQKEHVARLLRPHRGSEFHHGMCVGGDEEAAMIAGNLGLITVAHPGLERPDKRSLFVSDVMLEPKPNLERNRDIVAVCGRLLVAPQGPERVLRSGTWATLRHAEKVGRDHIIIYPDGRIGGHVVHDT